MTVSNAMNGNKHKMKNETYQKIMEISKELNYIPNKTARSLASKKSKIIALWLPRYNDSEMLDTPYHSFIMVVLDKYLNKLNYNLMILSEPTAASVIDKLVGWNIEGGIGLGITEEDIKVINEELDIPFVMIDSYSKLSKVYCITNNDYQGGFIGTEYLIKKNHDKVALVSGKEIFDYELLKKNGVLLNRYLGYKDAIKAYSKKTILIGEDISYDGGLKIGKNLSNRLDVTAVFCTADIMAAGIIEGLRNNNKSVPNDISIVGFDDLPISSYVCPKLTTIRQKNELKVKKSVQLLMELIKGERVEQNSLILDVNIVERDSVKYLLE